MKSFFIIIVFSILAQTGLAQLNFFEGSYEEAQAIAAEEGKLLFLDFYADWCMPCKQMERYGFRDAAFMQIIANDFIAYKVDVDQFAGMDVAESYKVKSYPTLIIATARGSEQKRVIGYQSADELKAFVEEFSD